LRRPRRTLRSSLSPAASAARRTPSLRNLAVACATLAPIPCRLAWCQPVPRPTQLRRWRFGACCAQRAGSWGKRVAGARESSRIYPGRHPSCWRSG
jgi:hypothetical protein